MTFAFEVFVVGFCVLWICANFQSCLALLSSPTRVAFLKVSCSIRDQSDLESFVAKRRCISSSSWDVLSISLLLWCILSRSKENWCVDRFYWPLGSGCCGGTVRTEVRCSDLCSEGGREGKGREGKGREVRSLVFLMRSFSIDLTLNQRAQ